MYNDKTGDKNEENDILKCFKNTTKAMNTVADANVDSDYEGTRVIAMVTRVTDSGKVIIVMKENWLMCGEGSLFLEV